MSRPKEKIKEVMVQTWSIEKQIKHKFNYKYI